ncbi:hypothetical protein L195_g006485 [Trifolium pratense]|uniref:Uncharacterized protein n=1 Tax=Trifolium pratense TaxID=57577 RepID=A0A2K3P3Q1_TRIPR|nr:hypothetical protein L195_g006485 [Trifolium pratense]
MGDWVMLNTDDARRGILFLVVVVSFDDEVGCVMHESGVLSCGTSCRFYNGSEYDK